MIYLKVMLHLLNQVPMQFYKLINKFDKENIIVLASYNEISKKTEFNDVFNFI